MSVNQVISQDHEKDIQKRLGGHASRGSGNQWANPMDGRHDAHSGPFVFAWDCKATRGKSIGVSREMLEKADEQAAEARPLIPLRWYDDDRAKHYSHDAVVINLTDFEEMLAGLDALERVKAIATDVLEGRRQYEDEHGDMAEWHLARDIKDATR